MKILSKLSFLSCILVLASFCLTSCGVSSSLSEPERKAVVKAIKSHSYNLSITTILPMGYPSKHVNGEYELEIRNKYVNGRLPFIGNVHSPMYAGADEMSVVFDKEKVNYKDDFNPYEKGVFFTSFKSKENNRWEIDIELYDNGTATIKCNSPRMGSITYLADIEPAE